MFSSGGDELIGVADADLRLVTANPRLALFLDQDGILGSSLLDLVPESVRPLVKLAARRITREVVLPFTIDGMTELLARTAIVGDQTWLLLFERRGHRPHPAAVARSPIVGRANELAELDCYLADPKPCVLCVQGPLGIGKTALLSAVAARCKELGCPSFWIDARTLPPTQEAFVRVLTGSSVERGPLERVEAMLDLGTRGWVLIVDNFDAWQDSFGEISDHPFAHLPQSCRIVIGSRRAPNPRSWGSSLRAPRVLSIGTLDEKDSAKLAELSGVTNEQSEQVLRRAGGHPLSIVLFANALRAGKSLAEARLPMDLDLGSVGPREVLEVAAIPARITEDVLAALLDDADPAAVFDSLTTLAVRDASGVGLRMPAVVRDELKRRLRERNPARLTELERRLALHVGLQLEVGGTHLHPIIDDFFDSLDDRILIKQATGSRSEDLPPARRAQPKDRDAIATAAFELGGEKLARSVLERFDQGFAVTAVAEGRHGIEGICQYVTLSSAVAAKTAEVRDDSELAAVLEMLRRRTSVSLDEYVLAVLSWSGRDIAHGVWGPPAQALFRYLFPLLVTRPQAAASVLVLPTPDFPLPTLDAWGTEESIQVGPHTVMYRELRGITARPFLTGLLLCEPARAPMILPNNLFAETQISSETIREALGHVDAPERLATSPLLSLRAIDVALGATGTTAERAVALDRLLRDAIASLGSDRAGTRQRDVLTAVFVERAGKHEKIAADLGMPYSTFRRWLTRGVERVTDMVRIREQSARRTATEHR